MDLKTIRHDSKRKIEKLKYDRRIKQQVNNMETAVTYRDNLRKCRSQLEECQREFESNIRKQSQLYNAAREKNRDTSINEAIIKDAAVGYLLVEEALDATDSVESDDGIAFAYEMLDAAIAQLKGKKNKFLDVHWFTTAKDKSKFGRINAKTAVEAAERFVSGFLQELCKNGDIKLCVNKARSGEGVSDVVGGFDDIEERIRTMDNEKPFDFDDLDI